MSDESIGNYDENYEENLWNYIPEPILLKILNYLSPKDILNISGTCKRFYEVSKQDFLWKKIVFRDFKIQKGTELMPGAESWLSEYKRLTYNIPLVETGECLNVGHSHQVLHVSFSNNGELFATCSKDGNVIIWNSSYPCSIKYQHNMKKFSWKYTQYSQFNRTDTLILVSGVHFGSLHSTSGEIAVFTVDEKNGSFLRCRVVNKPYDIFGTWFSDQYLISGDLQWLAHLVSTSLLWLNKANQEIDSENIPIMNHLYRFYNQNTSAIRSIMIANCPWLTDANDPLYEEQKKPIEIEKKSSELEKDPNISPGNPMSHGNLRQIRSPTPDTNYLPYIPYCHARQTDSNATIQYLEEYRKEFEGNCSETDLQEDESMQLTDEDDDLEKHIPKYLIFSTGTKTYTPHQIGIKRIRNVNFPKKLDPGLPLKERIAKRKRDKEEQNNQLRPEPDWWNYDAVADRFDKIDKIIDLHGHIIGMALSPDDRYLYVNTRPWPQGYEITNPLEPPPIAQEIDIHVIDLMTFKRVGNLLRAHKAYTPNTECFFLFLNVCDNYVASGAEDMHAYLWDRYYGMCLAKYKHNDVVNSVAFNPKDSEMLVTTSDDYTIKVWRSRHKIKENNIENLSEAVEFRKKT